MNGPDELDYFAAAKYAREWVRRGHFVMDSKARISKEGETIQHSLLEEENKERNKRYLLKITIF